MCVLGRGLQLATHLIDRIHVECVWARSDPFSSILTVIVLSSHWPRSERDHIVLSVPKAVAECYGGVLVPYVKKKRQKSYV